MGYICKWFWKRSAVAAVPCKPSGQIHNIKPHRWTRYGTTRAGTQRYRCYDCGQTAPAFRFEGW
ncbi:IS1/IS1595 family N-terminal zinc-binding domain-containing protein [Spirosoma migulaei]